MGGFAWVTLATNDSYSLGALVLAHSLKQAGTTQQLAVLVTPGVTNAMREKLQTVFNVVQEVNILDSRDEANLRLLKRPELGVTFTKLHCWRLTQYEKCVFLDADTLVLQNCDELFEREELSAAPDVGWPDCFNSGVFVYRPSNDTFEKLIQFALEKGSFDGGDQGLLNLYFSDWAHKDISKHLPFIYNMCSTACYSYLPAYKQFGANAKIVHFIGASKPWLQYFNTETRKVQPSGDSGHLQEVLQRWWDIFCSLIHPQLSPSMAGLAGAFARLTLGVARTPEQDALESFLRKQAWEVGNIDYLGKDSFDNILTKISETLAAAPIEAEPVKEVVVEEAKVPEKTEPTVIPTATSVQETPKLEMPLQLLPDTVLSPPVQTSVPLHSEEPKKVEASIVTAVIASELPLPSLEVELKSEPQTPAPEVEKVLEKTEPVAETKPVEPQSAESLLENICPITPKVVEQPKESPTPVSAEVVLPPSTPSPQPDTDAPAAKAPSEEIKPALDSGAILKEDKSVELICQKPQSEPSENVLECKQTVSEATETKDITEPTPKSELPESIPTEESLKSKTLDVKSAEAKEAQVESRQSEQIKSEVSESNLPESLAESKAEPAACKQTESTVAQETESAVPQHKITEATPPVTPSSPPAAPLPQLEKLKQALSVESDVPATPPPSSSQDPSPTPPPRKEGKPKKAAPKPKK